MHVQWKTLFSLGFVFWGLLCFSDILGESTWKRCSYNFDDILTGQYKEISKMYADNQLDVVDNSKKRMTWSSVLWNVSAFLCSLIFCSVIRSMSWIVWKMFKIYNLFRNRKVITNNIVNQMQELGSKVPLDNSPQSEDTKLIFRSQIYTAKDMPKVEPYQELEELKKEKQELSQQLSLAQKENLAQRQQIEEFKLETVMIREKLARTTHNLKENLKHKDLVDANQELIARKAHTLELHLKEVSRDRDLLRAKLSNLEKSYSKLEEKLRMYEKQMSESDTNLEQYPERDTTNQIQTNVPDTDVDICKFQAKIMALQRNIGLETQKKIFETNSKISVDLEDSSLDTSKENETENEKFYQKVNFTTVKRNILNYNAFKSRGTIRKKEQKKTLTHHLYFCMRDFGHHIGEDTEIYFSLYDACKQKYISERFLVKISKEGFSNYVEKLYSNCTVFTDLGNSDLNIYLVAHVMRIGKMIYSDSSKKTDKNATLQQQVFKRPHGVAVHNLGDKLTTKETESEEKEINLKLHPSSLGLGFICTEKCYYMHIYMHLNQSTSKYA